MDADLIFTLTPHTNVYINDIEVTVRSFLISESGNEAIFYTDQHEELPESLFSIGLVYAIKAINGSGTIFNHLCGITVNKLKDSCSMIEASKLIVGGN